MEQEQSSIESYLILVEFETASRRYISSSTLSWMPDHRSNVVFHTYFVCFFPFFYLLFINLEGERTTIDEGFIVLFPVAFSNEV